MNKKTKIILVGGFLGSGKTTMLRRLAKTFAEKNMTAGLITNDQAADLVDTAILTQYGSETREVSGSCFCCNFPGFAGAVESLYNQGHPDVIICEPVGSCTDLSATILQPLKDKYNADFSLAPLTVLADPQRLSDILAGGNSGLHESSAYIVRKQMEEADIIVINKSDLLTKDEAQELKTKAEAAFPKTEVFCASAVTADGVDSWLDTVMKSENAGTHLTQVDYDIYAEGEAVLGWLNSAVSIKGETDWKAAAEDYLKALSSVFAEKDAAIGHLKLMIQGADKSGFVLANLTGASDPIRVSQTGSLAAPVSMTINARVQMEPEDLKTIVFQCLDKVTAAHGITYTADSTECLKPGRPNPTYHYDCVVDGCC